MRLFLVMMLSLAFMNVSAQRFQSNMAFHLGSAGNNQGARGKFSYGAGLELGVNLSGGVAFMARPTMNFRGYKGGHSVNVAYLDVPVGFEFNWKNDFLGSKVNWLLGIGVYGGTAIVGKYKANGNKSNMKFGEGMNDNRSRIDYGLQGAFGWIGKGGVKWAFQLQLGLKNVVPEARQATEERMRLNNGTFYISFPLKPKS